MFMYIHIVYIAYRIGCVYAYIYSRPICLSGMSLIHLFILSIFLLRICVFGIDLYSKTEMRDI